MHRITEKYLEKLLGLVCWGTGVTSLDWLGILQGGVGATGMGAWAILFEYLSLIGPVYNENGNITGLKNESLETERGKALCRSGLSIVRTRVNFMGVDVS